MLLLLVGGYAQADVHDKFFEENSSMALPALKAKGNAYLEENKADSALLCFRIVTGRYRPNLSSDKQEAVIGAHINCGYIFSFMYNDFSQAFTDYQKAEEIVQETGHTDLLPYIYLNKGVIYANYNDSAKAVRLYNKAYYASIEKQKWAITLTSVANIIQVMDCRAQRDSIQGILRSFASLKIPQMEMLAFTRRLAKGAENISEGKWDAAIVDVEAAIQLVDLKYQPERDVIACYNILAHIYRMKHDYASAINYYRRMLDMSYRMKAFDCASDGLMGLHETYNAMGDRNKALEYKLQQLDLRDSLFSSHSYATIVDMESAYEINKVGNRVEQLEREHRQHVVVLTIVAFSALVFLIMLVIVIRKNVRVKEQNHILYKKNEKLLEMEEEREKMQMKEEGTARPSTGPIKTDDKRQELLSRINAVMADVDVITRMDFSLSMLAELTESKDRYVSQVINEECNKSFSVWLGELRIKEACHRIKDTDVYGSMTIEGVAMSLGFKSRSHFATLFKKITGLTPTEYQRLTQEEAK